LIGQELQWIGSHGMAAHSYPEMLAQVASGALDPASLVTRVIALDDVPAALVAMGNESTAGVTVVNP
jgi:threonine dehydrogenase-like Zn-dependent dehydrogenase